MFIPKNELKILEIETYIEVNNNNKIKNILSNTVVGVLGVAGGEPPTKFNIALTDKNLYIEAIGISAWGRLPESRYVEKIPLEKIKSFKVVDSSDKEFIEIITIKDKYYTFIRNNLNKDNLAEQMAKNIDK